MSDHIEIYKVFNGLGVPSSTYVAQEAGIHERNLVQGIREKGTLCLLTGSSKTGKTTLYNKVLWAMGKVPLIVRCDSTINAEDFWKISLEKVDFTRLTSTQETNSTEYNTTGKVGGTIGWSWLAGLIGEVSLGLKKGNSETEIREKILSRPSPDHLIPLLKCTNAVLVVEDFHYLNFEIQKIVFQQWKAFTDDQISVIVVGTTHHGVDLAYANPDLIGRIQQIDLKRWSDNDLKRIAQQGFGEIGISNPENIVNIFSKESSGLPIIMQQACAQLFFDKEIEVVQKGLKINFSEQDAFDALHNVATKRYRQFESWYTRLKTGPRKRARKYNTYEQVLSVFTLDPLKFELKRYEIDDRICKLPIGAKDRAPSASINSTLSALEDFQKRNGFELLEWSKRDQAIYVLEPAFLFYLRWRESRTSIPNIWEAIGKFLEGLNISLPKAT